MHLKDSRRAADGTRRYVLTGRGDVPVAAQVAALDIDECLAPFELAKHLSANRTQGVPNMIALVRETAERLAA